MLRKTLVAVLALVVLLEFARAAPVAKDKAVLRKKRSGETQKVQDQEKQLEQLVAIAGSKAHKPGTAVEKSHVAHTAVVNGQAVQHQQSEEKVTDLKSGKLVADVKQEVTQQDGSDAVVDTKVDLPAEGVHKEFVEHGPVDPSDELSGADVTEESIEFSPGAVAEYLLQTGEFDKFFAALADLVNSSVMTEMEADAYQQRVFEEYQRLLAQMEAFTEQQDAYDLAAGYEKKSGEADLGALYGEGLDAGSSMALDRTLVRQALLENRYSLSRAIDALLEAWWAQAYQTGDAQAQKLVNYLYYIVSKDKNPDDIGQIREILGDMLANALLDDLTAPESTLLGDGMEGGEGEQDNRVMPLPQGPVGDLDPQEAAQQEAAAMQQEAHALETAEAPLPPKAEEAVKQLTQAAAAKKSSKAEDKKSAEKAEDKKKKE